MLIGTDDDLFCKTFLLNTNTGHIIINEHVLDFPSFHSTHMISQNMASIKPDKNMLVTSFFSLPEIDIYSTTRSRLNTLFYKNIVYPEDIKLPQRDYYEQIHASDKYIYALFKNLENTEQDKYSHYIHIYDWDSNPIASLGIDTACDFFVDEAKCEIYTLNFEAEKDILTIYDLSFVILNEFF